MVTNVQVGLLRRKRMEKKTQETAAASADMSVRSARKWQTGPLPSETKKPRDWRTRPDAFAAVWLTVIVPLLVADTKGVGETGPRSSCGHVSPSNACIVASDPRQEQMWLVIERSEEKAPNLQYHLVTGSEEMKKSNRGRSNP